MSKREHYPETTGKPCNECPWRRLSRSGHLGPYTAHDWIKIAHSDSPIACHKTVIPTNPLEQVGSWDSPKIRQCAGAASFRRHVGKEPKHPEIVTGPPNSMVFATGEGFVDHHGEEPMTVHDMFGPLSDEQGGLTD